MEVTLKIINHVSTMLQFVSRFQSTLLNKINLATIFLLFLLTSENDALFNKTFEVIHDSQTLSVIFVLQVGLP